MKITLSCLFALYVAATAAAQEKTVPSRLETATVFLSGAELTHTASAALARGENEIAVEGISPVIDLQSLSVKATGGAVVSSWEFSVDHLSTAKSSPELKRLEDSLATCSAAIARVGSDIVTNGKMAKMLEEGVNKNVSGSENGLTVDELAGAMGYFKSRSGELYAERLSLDKRRLDLQNTQKRLRSQIDQQKGLGGQTSGVLRLRVTAPSTATGTFTISYVTSQAGWTPYYDMNVASTAAPIRLAGKAYVRQNTGLDWNRVALTLSTASPRGQQVAPLFETWLLRQMPLTRSMNAEATARNSVSYQPQADNLDEVVVVGYSTKKKPGEAKDEIWVRGTSDANKQPAPLMIIDGVPAPDDALSTLDQSSIKSVEVLKDDNATALYGSRAAGGVVLITTKTMEDYVSSSDYEAPVLNYRIELPYTIPGNGKAQNIDLRALETPAEYKYYCAPKLDTRTYLLAEIPDWQRLELLSGDANITYDGTFVGRTAIDAASTEPLLSLTLGTEERIAVRREKLRDFSAPKSLGGSVEQAFAYRITVRNNLNRAVKMVTKEQFPISSAKDIEVTLDTKRTTPWTAKKDETGVLTWETELAAGESRTYTIAYTVRYPRGMKLNL